VRQIVCQATWQLPVAPATTRRKIIDGPLAEARELVAGFCIWEVKDMDDAVVWAKRCPNPMPGPSDVDIRPFYEAGDTAELVAPEELMEPRDGHGTPFFAAPPLRLAASDRVVFTRRAIFFAQRSAA
jgi:hypothetical protein